MIHEVSPVGEDFLSSWTLQTSDSKDPRRKRSEGVNNERRVVGVTVNFPISHHNVLPNVIPQVKEDS